jgi:Kef-type K+ transport system membrane component KefB/nucleotide-binding universal stress UspA family protein
MAARGPAVALAACTALALPAEPALAAAGPTQTPSELLFVVQITVLLLVGRLLGEVMARFKQPAVMGQLIAGLLLGPSFFGALLPDLQHALFPAVKEQKAMLDALSQFGILMLLLLTGMETDLRLVRQTGTASMAASLAGIVVPFACGVALGEALPDAMLADPGKRLLTSLFIGTALSIASVKIVATVIREMNFMRRTVGQVILASAIIDDTVGWMITAVILSLALQGHVDALSLAKSVIGTIVFMGVSLTVGRRLVFTIIRWVNDTFVSDFAVITAILLIMCVMAIATDLIGVHTVLGAFVAGILIGESPILTRHIDEELRGLIIAFFMPVFFGTAGLSADLTILTDPMILALTAGLIVIASIGKFGGAFAGGKLGGLTWPESLALGCGMNARGSTEVIIATIGLSMGALSQNLFTMIVAMAVITTMAMPPTLRWALSRLPIRKEEKQRLEREEMEKRGFVPNLERLLLAVDDSANGKFASRIAGLLAGTRGMPTTVLHITGASKIEALGKTKTVAAAHRSPAKKSAAQKNDNIEAVANAGTAKDEEKRAEQTTEAVKEAAELTQLRLRKEEKSDARLSVTTIVHEAPTPQVIADEAKKGYDLMIVGLEKMMARDKEFHESVTALAAGFEGPLVICDARGDLKDGPDGKLNILVPVNGTEPSQRGAEVALAMARATGASLTALYVAVGPKRGRRVTRTRGHEEAILKDIVAIADGYNVAVRTAVLADTAANEAILADMKRRKSNLIVMGVSRRPGEKLFFGDTAAALLQEANASLLFVAS